MKTILVRVTREDIRNGKELQSSSEHVMCMVCPVAQAIHRIDGFDCAEVWQGMIVNDGADISISRRTRDFIRRFDSGEPVKPFSFRLKLK